MHSEEGREGVDVHIVLDESHEVVRSDYFRTVQQSFVPCICCLSRRLILIPRSVITQRFGNDMADADNEEIV